MTQKEFADYYSRLSNGEKGRFTAFYGVFADCLKSERLERFLDLLIENDWHIHFNSLNVLYWSIVDILDSIDGFASQIPTNIYMFKALFYRVMKSNL